MYSDYMIPPLLFQKCLKMVRCSDQNMLPLYDVG